MRGIEEEFVHLAQLIDGQALLDQNVKILERILGAVPYVVSADDTRLSPSMISF